jgi:hypothetical protein
MITIRRIDINRGQWSLSSPFTIGYITKASNMAMVKGKITDAAIFNTAPARIQQIKTTRKKTARPELKPLEKFGIFLSMPQTAGMGNHCTVLAG